MLTVMCFHRITGRVTVLVPLRYRALVGRYAMFNEANSVRSWVSSTPFTTWLQLPGVVVERG